MTIETMSRDQKREAREELRDAITDINEELRSKLDEIRELQAEVEALREAKAWRVEALKALKD